MEKREKTLLQNKIMREKEKIKAITDRAVAYAALGIFSAVCGAISMKAGIQLQLAWLIAAAFVFYAAFLFFLGSRMRDIDIELDERFHNLEIYVDLLGKEDYIEKIERRE